MDDKIPSDLEIVRLVRSLECEIPPDLDGRIRAAAAGFHPPAVKRRRLS